MHISLTDSTDGQKWPKHVGAKNWENIYHLSYRVYLKIWNTSWKSTLSAKTG